MGSLIKIKKKDMEYINGRMVENTLVFGKMENNMEREYIKLMIILQN